MCAICEFPSRRCFGCSPVVSRSPKSSRSIPTSRRKTFANACGLRQPQCWNGTAPAPLCVKYLIDNALPPLLAELLAKAGHDAVHVRAYAMQAATDEVILARALAEDRVVVSADTDFGAILANQAANRPSFILFRDPNLLVASDYAAMLLPALTVLEPELMSGCVAVFRKGRLPVRRLPLA